MVDFDLNGWFWFEWLILIWSNNLLWNSTDVVAKLLLIELIWMVELTWPNHLLWNSTDVGVNYFELNWFEWLIMIWSNHLLWNIRASRQIILIESKKSYPDCFLVVFLFFFFDKKCLSINLFLMKIKKPTKGNSKISYLNLTD